MYSINNRIKSDILTVDEHAVVQKDRTTVARGKEEWSLPLPKMQTDCHPSEKRAGSTVFRVYQRKYVCVYSDTVFTLILVCLLLLFKRVQGFTQDFNSHQ